MLWCGGVTHSWHHINRVSSCWDYLLGKRPSSRHNRPLNEKSTKSCWTGSRVCPMCRLHGCCCCSSGATRANYWTRTVSHRFSGGFAQEHDQAVMRCLRRIMRVDPSSMHPSVREVATLPFSLGGLSIRSAFRSRASAQWASWADCLATVKARHPIVAARFTPVVCLGEVQVCALAFGTVGIELPSWSSIGRRSPSSACTRGCPRPAPLWVATRSVIES